ncbi:MAG: hypothetical protein IPG99_06280 [Ignavibacteria bacterium]|nr:hypothetical protein [Ignavibacteria bacterium]
MCDNRPEETRYVSWSLSNTMTSEWCRSVVEAAIANMGQPGDNKSRSGDHSFTEPVLEFGLPERTEKVKISMDGQRQSNR